MGEVYEVGALFLACVGAGWLLVIKMVPRKGGNLHEGGTWRRVQESVERRDSTLIQIMLVREHEGRVTARQLISEIDSNDPDWNDKYTDAIAAADLRLAALESAERN